MSLLRDIQNGASSSDIRVADLLRQCKILAARLQSQELRAWVDCELDGYQDENDLPDYRVIEHVESRGQFFGTFGRQINNAPIPLLYVPLIFDGIRDKLKGAKLKHGVMVYEELLSKGSNTSISEWPADWVAMMAEDLLPGYVCARAWKVVPASAFIRVLDTVRNKVLGFALDIERENPQAGEAEVSGKTTPVPEPIVSNVFNQHFHGHVANVAAGSQDFEQNSTINEQGLSIDCIQLLVELPLLREALLRDAKLPEHFVSIGAVSEAEVEAQKNDTPKLLQALSKAGPWVLSTATSIGATVAADAIKKSMGIP